MLTASGNYQRTIGSTSQVVSGTLTITLPSVLPDITGALASVNLDASNTTDLPDSVRDTAGYSTIGGSITLAGPVQVALPGPGGGTVAAYTAADLFNPDNRDSPLYHLSVKDAPVTWSFGVRPDGTDSNGEPLAPEQLQKLPGVLSDMTLNHETGEVTCTIVDASSTWGSLPTVPAAVTAAPYNAGLTSEFPLDQIVRAMRGSSSWPGQRPGCLLAAGMRSSLWPEIGALDVVNAPASWNTPTFVPGLNGSALSSGASNPLYLYDLAQPWELDRLSVEAVMRAGSSVLISDGPSVVGTDGVSVTLTPGHVTVVCSGNAGGASRTLNVPIDANPHYVGVGVDWIIGSTTATITIQYDNIRSTGAITTPGTRVGAFAPYATVTMTGGTLEALQVWTEGSTFTGNQGFVPTAVIDPSLNPLIVVPEIETDAQAWDVIQQIAGAELGYARLDEQQVFRFTNRQTIATQTVQRTITADVALKTLTTSIGGGTKYDHIRVPYTGWTFGKATSVWTATDVLSVAPLSTKTWTQKLDGLVARLDTTADVLANSGNSADGQSHYRASTDRNGLNAHPGLQVTITQISAATVQIAAVNPATNPAYLVSPASYTDLDAGTPSLWIGGLPVTPNDEMLADVTYGAAKSLLTVSSNPYLQVEDAATAVAQYLLNQLYVPIRDFTDVAIIPDARLQIADLIRLQDPYRSSVDEYALIWGWSFNATFPTAGGDGGTWEMSLNVRALGPPDAFLGGIDGRCEAADSPTPSWAYA